jgi:hypothetical protein
VCHCVIRSKASEMISIGRVGHTHTHTHTHTEREREREGERERERRKGEKDGDGLANRNVVCTSV